MWDLTPLGKFIVGGPYYNNFPDIARELVEKGVYRVVNNSQECLEVLLHLEKLNRQQISINAVNAVSRRQGSVQCTLKEIHRFIG